MSGGAGLREEHAEILKTFGLQSTIAPKKVFTVASSVWCCRKRGLPVIDG
jgi:hypothetical protein